jgi:CheY-like chemotaxis protein
LCQIAVTGYDQEEDRRRAVETGFDDHLVKLVTLGHLRRLLDNAPANFIRRPVADLTD